MDKWMGRVGGLVLVMTSVIAHADGLPEALRAATLQNPLVAAKLATVEARSFEGDAAKALRYPTVSGQLGATQGGDTQKGGTSTLRARQPLWSFGRIDSAISFAQANLSAEEADLLKVRRQLLDETSVAYARVMAARERVAASQENVKAHDAYYQKVARRQKGQLSSAADVRLASARLFGAKALVQRYQGELDVARSELRALTYVPFEARQPVADSILALPALGELEVLAANHSADVRLKTERVRVAKADVEREKTAPMPSVYLQAEKYNNQPAYGSDVKYGLVLEGALDNLGFAARGRSDAALAREKAAQDELRGATAELERAVRSLWANREMFGQQLETQAQNEVELQEILASYERQFEAGQKSWLEVLNMQRELHEARIQRISLKSDWTATSLKLAALGGRLDEWALATEPAPRVYKTVEGVDVSWVANSPTGKAGADPAPGLPAAPLVKIPAHSGLPLPRVAGDSGEKPATKVSTSLRTPPNWATSAKKSVTPKNRTKVKAGKESKRLEGSPRKRTVRPTV